VASRGEVDLVEPGCEVRRQQRPVDSDPYLVEQPDAVEVEHRGTGRDGEPLRLVEQGRAHLLPQHQGTGAQLLARR